MCLRQLVPQTSCAAASVCFPKSMVPAEVILADVLLRGQYPCLRFALRLSQKISQVFQALEPSLYYRSDT